MDDLLRGLALVMKGLGDSTGRASHSLGFGTLMFGCALLFLDQGLLIVSETARWLIGVGALSLGVSLGRRFDARQRHALQASSQHSTARMALTAGANGGRGGELEQATGLEQVTRDLVVELAKVAHDAEGAKTIARRAGFPAEHLPDFKTAIGFWYDIVDQITSGRGSLHALVEEIARQFPHNPVFRERCEAIRRTPFTASVEPDVSHTPVAAGPATETAP